MSQNFSIPISRRDFLKLAGLTTAGAILTNPDQKVSAAENRVAFDDKNIPTILSVDVCVCGGGSAGVAAAISAAKNGLKILTN